MAVSERTLVAGVFTSDEQARRAIDELRHSGFSDDQIRVAGPGTRSGGFLESLKALFIGQGTSDAQMANDFIRLGVPEHEARFYQNEIKAGRTVVLIKAPGGQQEAMEIMRHNGAYEIDAHVRMYDPNNPQGAYESNVQQGQYNPNVPPGQYSNPNVPPGQYNPNTQPGQYNPNVPPAQNVPPGQYNPNVPPAQNAPPGQNVPPAQNVPPGQYNPNVPPEQYNPNVPPGQFNTQPQTPPPDSRRERNP